MRTGMIRNQRRFYFATCVGEIERTDASGDYTGETDPVYSGARECFANVSPASGTTATDLFGTVSDYDRVIGPLPIDCGIDEDCVVWIDKDPKKPHDYIVKRIARSLNHIMVLVSEVKTK